MTPYFQELSEKIQSYGGFMNSHMHLDRAGTYHATVQMLSDTGVADGTALSLAGKHAVVPMVHASECYDPDQLYARIDKYMQKMVRVGTARADTVVDTTTDRVGLSALETFARLKADYRDSIDLRIGAYSPLGFRDDDPERWALLVEGAAMADFIGLLPERDDTADYPDHIGFAECCRRGISLAHGLGKQVHIHVDQAFHKYESGSELVADLARELGVGLPAADEPFIWLIHVISPSAYDEARFVRLAQNLAAMNIGVICCPAAALSMRQFRPFPSPTNNCIARVLDLAAAGVHVRLGSDNICDITSPMGTVDLMDEVRVLGDAMRYYDIDFLARTAAGLRLDAPGMVRLKAHLADNDSVVQELVLRHAPDLVK